MAKRESSSSLSKGLGYALVGVSVVASVLLVGVAMGNVGRNTVLGDEDNKQEEQKKEEEKVREDRKETEIETADGQKIKTKVEDDGTTKIEVEGKGVKLKYKVEQGVVSGELEDEDGEEVEVEDDELDELMEAVESELEDEDMEVTAVVGEDRLVLKKDQVSATTELPVSINIETKELQVATPEGQLTVMVLPDQAVKNILATGILNQVGRSELEVQNNEMVYKVRGTRAWKVFGFIPVNTAVSAAVSATSGVVVDKQESGLTGLLDLISF